MEKRLTIKRKTSRLNKQYQHRFNIKTLSRQAVIKSVWSWCGVYIVKGFIYFFSLSSLSSSPSCPLLQKRKVG